MNEIMNISGVSCYEKDGTAYLNLEAVARGLGFTDKRGDVEYVRWNRVDGYLKELNFATSGERPSYIPENIFYRLAMKAKNETAEKFQALVADEIIPSVRKHGAYMTQETLQAAIQNPDYLLQIVMALKEETDRRKVLEAENEQQRQLIADYEPKIQYVDTILASTGTMATSQIAADYNMSARQLNKILHEAGIQHNVNGQWILYRSKMGMGYTKSITIPIVRSDGREDTKMHTQWTQKGRLMIHKVLTGLGIRATMDQE